MKCKYCGYEVEDGKVFCSSCGKEIQFVPDYNSFEDDLLREILEEESEEKQRNLDLRNKEREEARKQQKKQKQKEKSLKKKYILWGSAGIVCVVLVFTILLAIFINKSNKKNSYDYQMEQKKNVPSWRRICKSLLRNDYWCKLLNKA